MTTRIRRTAAGRPVLPLARTRPHACGRSCPAHDVPVPRPPKALLRSLTAPPDCDAEQFGSYPSVLDGRCRCLVCAHCGHHTGNSHQGHYWSWCSVTGTIREFHFCCPDTEFGCELEAKVSA